MPQAYYSTSIPPCDTPPCTAAPPRGDQARGRAAAERRLGLSSSHISTQVTLTTARGGRYVKLSTHPGVRNGGGNRGVITGFSRHSRRRLMQKTASLNRDALPATPKFITLTYGATWSEDWHEWKAHLEAFRKRFEREFGQCLIEWRLELQERGAPHFHLLVFHPEYIPYRWLAKAWNDIAAPGDADHLAAGTEVKRVRSWRGVASYVAKYMSKEQGAAEGYKREMGRLWGFWNLEACHVMLEETVLTLPEYVRMRRVLSHYREKAMHRKHRRGVLYCGMSVFMDAAEADRILEWLGVLPHAPPGEAGASRPCDQGVGGG